MNYNTRGLFLFLIFLAVSSPIAIWKVASGYVSSDEELFLFSKYGISDTIDLRYFVVSISFRFLYDISQYGIYSLNLIFVFFIVKDIKSFSLKDIRFALSLSLFFPVSIFYSGLFTRDFLLLILNVWLLILLFEANRALSLKVLLLVALIFFLRPTFGAIILFSFIVYPFVRTWFFCLFPFVLVLSLIIISFNDPLLNGVEEVVFRYENTQGRYKGYEGFSFFLIDYHSEIFPLYGFFNTLAFFFPYLIFGELDFYGVLMKINGIVFLVFIFRSIVVFFSSLNEDDLVYKVSLFVLSSSVLFSLIQTEISSALRVSMSFIPYLIYLCFHSGFTRKSGSYSHSRNSNGLT